MYIIHLTKNLWCIELASCIILFSTYPPKKKFLKHFIYFTCLISFMLAGYLMHTPRCLKSQRCLPTKGINWQSILWIFSKLFWTKKEWWCFNIYLTLNFGCHINFFSFEWWSFLMYIMAYVAICIGSSMTSIIIYKYCWMKCKLRIESNKKL